MADKVDKKASAVVEAPPAPEQPQAPADQPQQPTEGVLVEAPPAGTETGSTDEQPPADAGTGEGAADGADKQDDAKKPEKATPAQRLGVMIGSFIAGDKATVAGTVIERPGNDATAEQRLDAVNKLVDAYMTGTGTNIKRAIALALDWDDLDESWLQWHPFMSQLLAESGDPVRTLTARTSNFLALKRELQPTEFYQSQAQALRDTLKSVDVADDVIATKVREYQIKVGVNEDGTDKMEPRLEILDDAYYRKHVMPHAVAGGKGEMYTRLVKEGEEAAEPVGALNFIYPAIGTKVVTKANQSRVSAGNAPVQTPTTQASNGTTATKAAAKVLYKDGTAYEMRQGSEKKGVWEQFAIANKEQLPAELFNDKGQVQNFYNSTGYKGTAAIDHFLEQGDNRTRYQGLDGLKVVEAWALANGFSEQAPSE